MKSENKNIWVYMETFPDGSARPVGAELLGMAKSLWSQATGEVIAVVLGWRVDKAVQDAKAYGADTVIFVDRETLQYYATDRYVDTLYALVLQYQPDTIVIGATPNGRDLAPRLSCRLKTGLTADCTGVKFQESSDALEWSRPALSGYLMANIVCANTRPQMGTIRAGVFPIPSHNPEAKSVIVRENPQISDKQARTELLEILENAANEKINLEEASIIVAGGLGVGSKEGFGLIRELAEVLNGSVAASRKVVEAGWISRGYQIGQTGKTVAPQLYIACGISGALQHLVGMQSSARIVAINADAEASIFKVADYGIIGDLYKIIPLMVEEIQKRKERKYNSHVLQGNDY